MAQPAGTDYYIKIIANKTYSKNIANFLYQVDVSESLLNNAVFKSCISTSANVAIYDNNNDVEVRRHVFLDLANNQLYIYFTASASASIDREFYVCVGSGVSALESTAINNTFKYAGYLDYWPIKEFTDGSTTLEACDFGNMAVEGNATIGNDGLFGKCAYNPGDVGEGRIKIGTAIDSGNLTVEMLVKIDSGGYNTYGNIIDSRGGFQLFISDSPGWTRFTNNHSTKFWVALSWNVWHHVLIRRESSGITIIYVDGIDVTDGGKNGGTPI